MPKKEFSEMTIAEIGAPGRRAVQEIEEMIRIHGEDVRALAIAASLDAFTDLLKTPAGKLFIKMACLECQKAEMN